MRNRMLRLLVGASLLLAGCYGQYALTSRVHAWNGRATSNAFVNSAIMWGLIIIPVYEICLLGDLIVFNTIEVFSGSNPVAVNKDGSIDTRYAGHDYRLSRFDEQRVEVAVDGRPRYRYRQQGADLLVEDLDGKLIRVIRAPDRFRAESKLTSYSY